MPDLQYGLTNIDRDRGNLPKIPVVNMFVEKVDSEPNPVLQSRPGLENTGTTLGAGPVHTLFKGDGVLSGQMFAVSGTSFYSNTTNLGTVAGSGPYKIAGFQNRVFVTGGSTLSEWDGVTYSTDAMPGGFSVQSLCIGTDRLIVIDKGTGHFYWSNVLSDVVDALSFATAEQSPDQLKECLFIGDTLMLFGSETVEFWPASVANPDLPFSPLIGRTFRIGIRDTGCAVAFGNTFAWVTNYNQIAAGDPNNIISNSGLDEKISKSANCSLWTFRLEGTEFLVCTLDTSTWVFSSSSSTWSVFESYGADNWIPQCFSADIFGSSIDGHLIQWSDDYQDFGDVLERRFRAGLPLTMGTTMLNNLVIRTNQGQSPFLSGIYEDPVVELRTSKDGGFTFSTWKGRSLGKSGNYRSDVQWRSLGFFGYPSLLVEIRVTDPVPFRVSGVTINEGYGSI